MAGSMKDIKLRIKSVESTMQITKAMELVASSKLRHAKQRVEKSRPCFEVLHQTLADIAASNTDFSSVYTVARPVKRTCYVVIAGDRGLAGGYNANVFKTAAAHMQGRDCCVLPVGKKALEQYQRLGTDILSKEFAQAEDVSVGHCFTMARMLAQGFLNGEFDEVYVVYTNFVSMLTQTPAVLRLLPLNAPKRTEPGPHQLILYEPDCESVYNAIVPEYLAGLVYGALCESVASEMGARRTAMDAASKNAGEMIENLSLHYNRARQAAITQEITEIVAGGEA
nr:ATP synthase F1 subunit gamma [uncultured Gemmiger sp.]